MKKIGLVGGMSWQSTLDYYKYINEYVEKEMGGLNSAEIILSSINFAKLEKLQREKKWKLAENLIFDEVEQLVKYNASLIGICSNTGNEGAERIQKRIRVPLVHIVDPIGEYVAKHKLKKLGLIGTIYTMEGDYIKEVLARKYGVEIFIPNKQDRIYINRVIYEELCKGIIKKSSREKYLLIINKLINDHKLDGFVLGCTEIPLLISQEDININLINSTKLHAEDLARKSL